MIPVAGAVGALHGVSKTALIAGSARPSQDRIGCIDEFCVGIIRTRFQVHQCFESATVLSVVAPNPAFANIQKDINLTFSLYGTTNQRLECYSPQPHLRKPCDLEYGESLRGFHCSLLFERNAVWVYIQDFEHLGRKTVL
jgi:hypothetical protein